MHKQDHRTCQRIKFCEDLIHLLKTWHAAGDCILVYLNAKKDIYKKALGNALTEEGALEIKAVLGSNTDKKIGPTLFRGQFLIDGIWAASNVIIANASQNMGSEIIDSL